MADILLTHSYHLANDPKQVRKMQPYPPLGTLYAASALREPSKSVAVFDHMLQDPVLGFPEALQRHRPRRSSITRMISTSSRRCASPACAAWRGNLREQRAMAGADRGRPWFGCDRPC